MGNITREQIKKWESECKNDFKFDVQYYIFHNEKTLEKIIKLDETNFLKVHLMFYNKYEDYKQVGYYINVNISKWHNDGSMSVSHGLGINYKLNNEIYQKRSFKELQKATEMITDEIIMSIYNQDTAGKKQLENAVIIG